MKSGLEIQTEEFGFKSTLIKSTLMLKILKNHCSFELQS